jgi:hypothetical protein
MRESDAIPKRIEAVIKLWSSGKVVDGKGKRAARG